MLKNSQVINKEKIKQADLVVGIPSLNEADNIAFVTKKVDQGIRKYFKNKKAVIINCDNDSADGTRAEFLNAKTTTPKIYISTPPGIRGKGNNFYNLFHYIKKLNASTAVVVDADLESITPEWIKHLASPILEGFDYATPYYARSEYDGSITNNICYPLLNGFFGIDVRQPIGGDFSFSGKLADYWLSKKWHKTTKKYGIDIFMTMNAVIGGFKIAQVGLGAKIHKPSAPKLGPMFSQVVTTMFKNIITNRNKYLGKIEKKSVPYFGEKSMGQPQTVSVDYKGMKATSIFNFHANEDILKRALSPTVFNKLKRMYDKGIIDIGSELWCRIVYDAIFAYDKGDLNGGLIEALKPLYFGRFVTFFKTTIEKPFEICEQEITDQAEIFWKNRNYLIRKYSK